MHLKKQKYIIIFVLFSVNLFLAVTFVIYIKLWYVYLCILALASAYNSISCLCNIGHKMLFSTRDIVPPRITGRNYLYIVPCYTETEDELKKTLNSIVLQREVKNDIRGIIIICDGSSFSKNNICDKVLLKILTLNAESKYFPYATWDQKENYVQLCTGKYTCVKDNSLDVLSLPVVLLIKIENYGKRDSLVLVRRCCYQYNQSLFLEAESVIDCPLAKTENSLQLEMLYILNELFQGGPIAYIIGTDADTVLDYNCSFELVQSLEADSNVHGCVGYVDIAPEMNFYGPFILYQYAEYLFAQCLRRQTQSRITQKVNCLSGCVQILRVSEETCGEKILQIFNYLPGPNESIFAHIRSYASEDRNHVCNMLSLYPYVKTTQNLQAIAYTTVPTNCDIFLSQRRRWSLGASTNDMLLLHLPGIVWWERISAGINLLTYSLNPFICIATALFIKAIIVEPTYLMLYLSILSLIPLSYAFIIIPLFVKRLSFRATCYFYMSYTFFFTVSSLVNLVIFVYAISCMDVMKWGKTRQIVQSEHVYISPTALASPANAEGGNEYEVLDKVVDEYNVLDEYKVPDDNKYAEDIYV